MFMPLSSILFASFYMDSFIIANNKCSMQFIGRVVLLHFYRLYFRSLLFVSKSFVGVLYLGYRGSPVAAYEFGYDRFPQTTNGWGAKHPISDMVPPLLAEEEGSSI
jgi:hypothetical protein